MSVEWEGPGWAGLVLPIWGMCLFGLTFSSPGKEVQRLGLGRPEGKAGLEVAGLMEERREAGEGKQGGWGPRGRGGPGRRGGRAEAEGWASFCIRSVPSLQTATAIRVPGPGKRITNVMHVAEENAYLERV